ncbi:hypothetical protein B0T17DRAFT_95987 [Bombardia bombarda]|uniref:Uncharacterized protein n=1 Tax=Bombardia bombarda TaxID=252184 RepID=A0AA39XNP1_9PEZI|nr:hypothetical protein B0T17DRAFT_95987 [Bombardia bombarda]
MSQGAQAAKQSPFTLTRMFSDGPSPYPITQSLTPTEFISVEQPMVAYPGNIPLDLNYHLDGTQHAYMAGPGNPNMLGGGMAGSGGMPSAMHAWASMPPGHSPMQDYDILDPCMVHTTETTNSPSANLVGYEVATSSNSISSKSASSSNSNMIQYQTGSDQGPSTRASVSLSSDGQDEILRFPQSSIHYGSDLGEELHRVSIEALCTADELSDVISRVVGVARSVTVKVHK